MNRKDIFQASPSSQETSLGSFPLAVILTQRERLLGVDRGFLHAQGISTNCLHPRDVIFSTLPRSELSFLSSRRDSSNMNKIVKKIPISSFTACRCARLLSKMSEVE
jgi:hypothetical protein